MPASPPPKALSEATADRWRTGGTPAGGAGGLGALGGVTWGVEGGGHTRGGVT